MVGFLLTPTKRQFRERGIDFNQNFVESAQRLGAELADGRPPNRTAPRLNDRGTTKPRGSRA
jgi:hypothetical protein